MKFFREIFPGNFPAALRNETENKLWANFAMLTKTGRRKKKFIMKDRKKITVFSFGRNQGVIIKC